MTKLKLDVEALRVDSFEPARAEAGAGTVRAHGWAPREVEAAALDSTLSYLYNCFNTQQRTCTCRGRTPEDRNTAPGTGGGVLVAWSPVLAAVAAGLAAT